MLDDLASVLGRQESAGVEFKRQATDRDALRKAVCAMANDLAGLGGGDLVIGVDAQGAGGGVDTSDDALLAVTDLRDDGRVLDRPSMVVTAARWDGQPVIRVRVTASGTPPVRVNGTAWVRPGPTTRRATPDDERVLSERRLTAALPFDGRGVVGSRIEDLDLELVRSTYLPSAVSAEVLEENHRPLREQLASLRLTDAGEVPTATGLLLAAYDPTAFLPGAYVQFVRYEGLDEAASVVDDVELRDNLVGALAELERLVRSHVRTRLVATGLREESQPDYPFDALRELLVNALMHRNYESTASSSP